MLPAVIATAAARLAEPDNPEQPRQSAECNGEDRLISRDELALRLGMDAASVVRRRFPFAVRLGYRTIKYSEAGLRQWLSSGGRA